MNKIIKAILLVVAFISLVLLAVRSAPPNPVAIIKVVDTAGKPIAGALIRPDGLRPKRINSHWTWMDDNPVKPTPVKTDANGTARVFYPRYVYEKTETGEISFAVEHPDYCSDRPFRVVSAAPPANATLKDRAIFVYMFLTRRVVTRPEPVVLKRGGTVKVSARLAGAENPLPHVYAQLASMSIPRAGYWQSTDSGALINRRIPEGTNAVRLVYLPPTGKACFSGPASFLSVPGQTNEFNLELKPGFRLNGKLDESALRPITHGRVQVSVSSERVTTNRDRFSWRAWKEINADGTFSFDSLPAGKAEVIAACDGFKSKDGPGKIADFCMPQVFQLTNGDARVVIVMEPTTTCEITVLDDKGRPLPDAEAFFWPNVIWNGQGSSIFAGWTFNSEDVYRSEEDFDWRKLSKNWPPVFQAYSDKRGIATVSNLPAFNQYFTVTHTNFELPIEPRNNSRYASAQLLPGQTNRVTVTMQKKGTRFLKSPR